MQNQKTEILKATLQNISEVTEDFKTDIGVLEETWFSPADLSNPESPALVDALERVRELYPEADTRTCAALFINEYAWYVPAVFIAAYLLEKRVPVLDSNNIAIRHNRYTWESMGRTGESSRIDLRLLSDDFAGLIEDTEAKSTNFSLFPNADALRESLRQSLEFHMIPIIKATQKLSGLSRGALWRIVADSVSALFLQVGTKANQSTEAEREGLAFVKAENSPMNNPQLEFINFACGTYNETFRMRGGCCRFYTLPERDYCTTCVLRKPEERNQRLQSYVEYKAQNNP